MAKINRRYWKEWTKVVLEHDDTPEDMFAFRKTFKKRVKPHNNAVVRFAARKKATNGKKTPWVDWTVSNGSSSYEKYYLCYFENPADASLFSLSL